MELHQIRYFLAVSRTLNFTQAAAECNVAQPSLTRAIKKLEAELGGDLFRRERRRTHLTDLGRLMGPLLAQCHDGVITAKTLADSYGKGDYAPLRLALSKTINLAHLIGPFTELTRALPGLALNFFRGSGDQVVEQLMTGEAELGVAGPVENDGERLDSWPLFTEAFYLVTSREHPLSKRNSVDLQTLAGERLLSRPYCEMYAALTEMLRAHGIDEQPGHQMATEDDLVGLLDANAGIAILPASSDRHDHLSTIDVAGLDLQRTVYLYAVSGRQWSPAAAGLLKLMRSGVRGATDT